MITARTFLIVLAGCALPLHAEEYGGVEFPEGARSFADEVVSYTPDYSGGPSPTDPDFVDPQSALGPPDYVSNSSNSVSLGAGGRVVLRFTNNLLTGSDEVLLRDHNPKKVLSDQAAERRMRLIGPIWSEA